MRLLFCIKTMDDARGGAERVLAVVTSALAEANHDVTLLSFDREGGAPFYELSPRVRQLRLGLGKPTSSTTVCEALKRIPALRSAVASEVPDVVVAFMHSMFVPCAVALTGTGTPLVASEHIVPAHYKSRRFEYALLLGTSALVSRYTVLSSAVKESYPAFLRPKMVPIANPVERATGSANPSGEAQRKRLLTVGRLDPQKDQRTLIQAFARIAEQYSDWELRIVGDGALRAELQQLIESLGLRDRVMLAGTTREIGAEYRAAHIFVLPSLYESFGLATAEAMSYGLPAVGFRDCPGTNELITHGTDGLLVHGADRVDALARGLESLMSSPELRSKYGGAAPLAVARYSTEAIVSEWERLLDEVQRGARA